MNYSDYFTNRPTDEITRDLVGRPLIYDNGKEKLGGYIVEAEAYMGKNDRAATLTAAIAVLPTRGFIAAEATFIFMRRGNTSFSTLLVKKKTSLKECLSEQSNPSGELIL